MERPSLDDAFDKLRWAEHHLGSLGIEVFHAEEVEDEDYSDRFRFEVDAEAGEHVIYINEVPDADPDWGLKIGDCVHNARTALDYLMVRIVSLIMGRRPRDIETVQFPIETDPAAFASKVGGLRKQNPVFSGYLTRMEELQPYNQGNPSIWGTDSEGKPIVHPLPGALRRLSILDNIDKHRGIHAAWFAVSRVDAESVLDCLYGSWGDTGVIGVKEVILNREPLVDGAEICRVRFERGAPLGWEPRKVDMKGAFPLSVAFDEPLAPVQNVLSYCLAGVRDVLKLFEPVFLRGEPPLPVTTVPIPPFSYPYP